MDFSDFIYFKEMGLLIEAPTLTTRAVGVSSKYIDPVTGKPWRRQQNLDQLKKIKEEYPNDNLYVHFSDGAVPYNKDKKDDYRGEKNFLGLKPVPKLGIFPRAGDGGTPLGIYAYPINYVIDKKFNVPFGSGRKFILVFKLKKENILSIKRGDEKLTKIDELLSYFRELKKETDIRKIINKRIIVFAKLIKKQTIKNVPNIISDLMYRRISSRIDFVIDYVNFENDSEVKRIPKNLEPIAELVKYPEFYKLSSTSKEEDLSIIKKYLNIENVFIDLDELEINFQNEQGEVIETNSLIDEILFKYKENPRSDILSILSSHVVKKNMSFFEKVSEKIKKLIKKIEKIIESTEKKRNEAISNFNFPFKEEFSKIASEHGLDLTELLSSYLKMYGSKLQNNTFVYRFTYTLSQQIADKLTKDSMNKGEIINKKYYVIWTSLLKRLGIMGVTDDEDTGTIFSGEDTQSVFFDTKQLELVSIFENARSRGLYPNWETTDSPIIRWFKGISRRINTTVPELYFTNLCHKDNLIYNFSTIIKLIIYLNSYFRFAKKIEDEKPQLQMDIKGRILYIIRQPLNSGEANWPCPAYQEHISLLEDIVEKLKNYATSSDLTIDLPSPHYLRNVIKKIEAIDITNLQQQTSQQQTSSNQGSWDSSGNWLGKDFDPNML